MMDDITLADLGLKGKGDRRSSGAATICTQAIYESTHFDMVIFLLPKHARLPFHDHPGMTVFSKVLYGALNMVSCDWKTPLSVVELQELTTEQERLDELMAKQTKDPQPYEPSAVSSRPLFSREVQLRANTILTTESPTFILRPDFANIHSFEARSDCAVLDVLMPPYDEEAGRDCHYFELLSPNGTLSRREEVYLRQVALHSSVVIQRSEYRGSMVRPR